MNRPLSPASPLLPRPRPAPTRGRSRVNLEQRSHSDEYPRERNDQEVVTRRYRSARTARSEYKKKGVGGWGREAGRAGEKKEGRTKSVNRSAPQISIAIFLSVSAKISFRSHEQTAAARSVHTFSFRSCALRARGSEGRERGWEKIGSSRFRARDTIFRLDVGAGGTGRLRGRGVAGRQAGRTREELVRDVSPPRNALLPFPVQLARAA